MSLSKLIQKGGLRGLATATPATVATDRPRVLPTVATVATVNVATSPDIAANDSAAQTKSLVSAKGETAFSDPDRWCWPDGSAMNTIEIDTFTARLTRFIDKGLPLADAEALADRMVKRDREMDDRHLCLECVHLRGSTGGRHCGNAVLAGMGMHAAHALLPNDLTRQPQRCAGFTNFHGQGDNP